MAFLEKITAAEMTAPLSLARCPLGRVVVFSAPRPGKQTANEDSALVMAISRYTGLLAVADGLGGLPAGDQASQLALDSLIQAMEPCDASNASLRECILDGIESANRQIMRQGGGGATTLAVVEVSGEVMRPYHVGDAMVVVCGQRGKLKLQTVAHAPVAYAVEAGVIDEDQAMVHEDRHLVSNVVGAEDMRMEVGAGLRLALRDTVVIASDGLFDNMTVPEVVEVVRAGPLEQAMATLVETCLQRMADGHTEHPGKPDDLSIILYRPV